MNKLIKFEDNELNVRKDNDGNICLTDLWKLAGSDENKRPVIWQRHETTIAFCRAVSVFLKGDLKSLLKTTRGKSGATWAHTQIALEYAQYLDPNLAVIVNQNFFDRIEEEKNPDLIAERYVKTYQRKGKTLDWIQKRFKSKETRNTFTSTLARHKVEQEGFKNCTNAIYDPLFGGTTSVVREKKGITKKDNIRDNLSAMELVAIEFSEMMATENIEMNNLTGNAQCEIASRSAAKIVANALVQNRRSLSRNS
jgi:hypothetical protein